MIPRYQRILATVLGGGSLLMLAFLLYGCEEAHRRLSALEDETPIAAPAYSRDETVSFYMADDASGSIEVMTHYVPLASDPTIRARVLLEHLLAEYALPNSAHPIPGGPAVDDVFLLPLPIRNPPVPPPENGVAKKGTGELAVVNLRRAFADTHPSGIEVENLTVQSMLGTIYANVPGVTEVRFLVDGQPRETLAGHVDLTRTYAAVDTASKPAEPSAETLP